MCELFIASETSNDQVSRHAAEYEKVLNEQSTAEREEAAKVSDALTKDRWMRLSENIRAHLVSELILFDFPPIENYKRPICSQICASLPIHDDETELTEPEYLYSNQWKIRV